MSTVRHLVVRFLGSLSRRPPSADDTAWVRSHLQDGEFDLWCRLWVVDRRHSIVVARRFVAMLGTVEPPIEASRDLVAGALLHDVGKVGCGLGVFGRVLATIVGPRTAAFARYHDHERIGLEAAAGAGSSPTTLQLLRGEGSCAAVLRRADDV